MTKHEMDEGRQGAAHEQPARAKPLVTPHERFLIVEKPIWERRSGELSWRDEVVLDLTDHASVEEAILDEFQRLGWIWVIPDPRQARGEAGQSRRNAVRRLNENQGKNHKIQFGSLSGKLVCWSPAEWLP